MDPGLPSSTAHMVAYLRALGNLSPQVSGFEDAMAERMLPPPWSSRVQRARSGLARNPGRSPFPIGYGGMGLFHQYRTRVLDQAIQAALPFDQLVILGAGLDSRAWRMPALAQARVFELDHPDTQAWKRKCAQASPPQAREVRFIPMDFSRDDLGQRLLEGGYDAGKTTFWLWEGVAMYLSPGEVARTLAATAGLSREGSRLAATYLSRQSGAMATRFLLAAVGEPCRSAYAPEEWAGVARQAGWDTGSDSGIQDWKRDLASSQPLAEGDAGMQWHERIWVGDRIRVAHPAESPSAGRRDEGG